jgi:predicted nucleic acid-binding protein
VELKDIPNGSKVFIDASIFLTVALKRPKRYVKACREFLVKVEKNEVEAFLSNLVLDEILYKLIQAEVAKRYGIKLREVSDYVKRNPTCISQLSECWRALEAVMRLGVTVLAMPADFNEVAQTCRSYNLLTRDALHIATMRSHGLGILASTDSDFKRVPWIKLYQP